MIQVTRPLFPLGRCLVTPGALDALAKVGEVPWTYFNRHARGDWGDVCTKDKQANDAALRNGERLLSAYQPSSSVRIWVITEADRSATTILLPEEY